MSVKSGDNQREQIRLVETLWWIECRHLLGDLSESEYHDALIDAHGCRFAGQPGGEAFFWENEA